MKNLGTRLAVFAFAVFAILKVGAETAVIDGVEWQYYTSRMNSSDESTTYAIVQRVSGDVSGDIVIPSTLGGWPVRTIGEQAFYNCTNMTSIKIPRALGFGARAFKGCTGLIAVHVDDVATWCLSAFSYEFTTNRRNDSCNPLYIAQHLYVNGMLLTELTVPDGVATMGQGFYGYTNLTSVVIPDSCIKIAPFAFGNCTSLRSAYVGDGVTNLDDAIFARCVNLADVRIGTNVISIWTASYNGYGGTFGGCTSLESIVIPEKVESISSAFGGCSSLTNVTFMGRVKSIGDGTFSGTALKSIEIPNSVTYIGDSAFASSLLEHFEIPDSIQAIHRRTFNGCSSLTSIKIPSSVKTIGVYAFSGCSNLSQVYIDDLASWCSIAFQLTYSNPNYQNSQDPITAGNPLMNGAELFVDGVPVGNTLHIPNGVTNIAQCAFYGWTNITSVTMADSVKEIGRWAFSTCNGLQNVTIGDGVLMLRDGAFGDCKGLANAIIGSSVTNIGSSVFAYCTNLKSAVMPDGIRGIGASAFTGDTRLGSVTLGSNLESLGNSAFWGCTNLTSIVIPDSVTNLGESVFQYCYYLKSAVVGNGVTSLNKTFNSCWRLENVILGSSVEDMNGTFSSCSSLEKIQLPKSLKTISSAFSGTKLTTIVLPDGVENISGAFSGCTCLTDIVLPNSVRNFGQGTFAGCGSLRKIVIPLYVTSIGNNAFKGCNVLREVFIPPAVTDIGGYAFQNCTNLEKVVFAGIGPTVGYLAFSSVKAGCTAYVPWGTEGWGVSIPGTWNGINIAYLFTGKNELDDTELPETIVVQSDAEVTVRSQRTPAELEAQLHELMARAEAMFRESGQSPHYYTVSGVCDEANGTITLRAAIDAAKIGLEETTSEVVGADALATFKADGTMRLTSAKEGFYYGLAAAGRLEDLDAAVDAVKADGLTRADGGGVNLSAARPSGGSAFFKVVVSDRQRDD